VRILRGQPIRRQVVGITGALLVPFAIAAAWTASRTRAEHVEELREQSGALAATAGAYLNQYLSGLDSMASALVRHPAISTLHRAESDRLFAAVLRDQPLLVNILLTDTEGTIKGSAVAVRDGLDKLPTVDHVRAVVKTGKPVVSELLIGAVSNKPLVVLAYPVQNAGGSIGGVLELALNLERLETLFRGIPLPPDSVVTLTDAQSRVLARSRDTGLYIGKPLGPEPTPPEQVPRTQVLSGPDHIERAYGNAVIDRGPWVLSVGIPTSLAITRTAPLYRRNLIIAIAAIGAVLLLALALSTQITRGLNGVRDAARKIAGGDLSPPARTRVPNRELADLEEAFITMAANLREAHDALDHQVEQERKMRETLQSLQRQVVRQERLAAVGVLVSGVAHELNNPLQAILGTAELLERHSGLGPDALEEVAFVKIQSGRAREIIRNLSRFSSQQSGPPTLVDLRDVIGEVVQLRRRDLDNLSIALDVELTTTRKVYANFTEVEQVTLNFVINAQQAIESAARKRGRILIRVFDAGKKVRLEVQDDGPGVKPEDEPKLFQPFFTTKPVGKGTGLGLSVSYGIIESYGGAIGYRNNEWGGATFFFELPVTEPAARPITPPRGTARPDDRPPLLHRPVSKGV
jgi:C4-dicarboxylate-specific signal transduction histidine kinase